LHLPAKKPWALDVSYFAAVKKALYLTSMAVIPTVQRQGIGRRLLRKRSNLHDSGQPRPFVWTLSTL
jgi:predicted N-acetyltransferase YhbS